MIVLIALSLLQDVPKVEDYFPMVAGEKRHYSNQGDAGTYNYTETVLPVETLKDTEGIPFQMVVNGKIRAKTYYRVDGDTVYMIARDPKVPFPTPRPVLRLGKGKLTWTWTGMEDQSPLKLKCESQPKGKRKVLGVERQIYDLKLEADLSIGDMPFFVKQEVLYANGVGMIEMKEERRTKKTFEKRTVTLESYEQAEGGLR